MLRRTDKHLMKVAIDSLLAVLDAGTSFCYWLLGRNLLQEEQQIIKELFNAKNQHDETHLVNVIKSLSIGKDLLLVCNDEYYNLIQWCILHDYLQALELLLKYGCNPNRGSLLPQTPASQTIDLPLALACCFQRKNAVRLLLYYGGNPKQPTTLSKYTLQRMSKIKKLHCIQIVDLLYQYSLTPLKIIFAFDDLEIFKIILSETRSPLNFIIPITTDSNKNYNNNNSMDEILTSFQSTDELTNRVLIKNIENENNVYSDTITPHYDCLDDDDNNHEIQEKDESEEVVVLNDDEEIESEQHLIFSTSLDMNNRKHENDIFSSSKFFTELSISSDDATKTWALRIQNEHVALQKSQQQPQTAVEIPITKSEKSIFTMKNVEQTTTDGGYYTTSLVDGSVEDGGDSINKTKATLLKTTTNNNSLMFLPFNDNSTMSLWSTARENNNQAVYRKNTNQLNRTISQQMGTNVKAPITGRLSLPNALEINGISYSSSTSSLISLSSPKTPSLFHHKTSTKIFRLVQQMIDSESEYILDYFLKQSQQELYVNHHPHQQQEQLKILYNLLANVKSERIYNVLSRYYSFKITICDKNNNTLLHLLFSNKPHNFEPEQMKIITERYLTTGLKDFLNRPNLSNEYIIQILLQNKHFIYMLFFSQTKEFEMELNHHSAMCTNNRHTNMSHSHQPDVLFKHRYGDLNLIEEWRETYLYLIELLIDNGSKIDMPTGKYQNSIDCLLSAIISFIQQKHQQHAYSSNQFDIKYLKKLLTVLFLTSSTLTSRLKYTIERFLQLICHIHITNDELNDTMDIFHLLCQCEFQPIKLNMNTIIHLLKSWLINPNFLCSNLIGKCLFIQQLLVAIVRFHTEEQIVEDYFTNNRKLLKSTVVEFRKGALLFHVLSLIPYAQTCVQINSIYELTLALICHGLDPDYSIDDEHLLIVTVCLLKITNKTLTKRLLPFINLFVITQSSLVIDKSINILQKKMITKTNELYQHLETLIVKTRTLKQISIKHIYNKCKKPFVDSVQSLSLNETLKHRLIRLQM